MNRKLFIVTLLCVTAMLLTLGEARGQQATTDTQTTSGTLAAKPQPTLKPRVQIQTSLGNILLELDGERAPISVANFIQYAEEGFYKGTIFHRVISNFMIQGGGHKPDLEEKSIGLHPPIKNEYKNGLKNTKGTIAMARMEGANTATAQFYINVADNVALDGSAGKAGYAVFGKVIGGQETVEKIRNTPVGEHPAYRVGKVVPIEPVVIENVKIVDTFDKEAAKKQTEKKNVNF